MAAPALIGAGALIGAYGSIRQGQSAQAAGQYNAEIARNNARAVEQEGRVAEVNFKRRAEQQIGAARASYGASGVRSDVGSPLDVLQSSQAQAAEDAMNLKYSYRAKALGYSQSADLYEFEGDQAMKNSYFTAAGQLLGGAGRAVGVA